jgi:PQQ-dependent catabolism-associated CXXCW motif protein
MSRHLCAIAVSLTLCACVYQPPTYWGRQGSPYPPTYYPQSHPVAWYAPPSPRMPYASPSQASYTPSSAPDPVSEPYASRPENDPPLEPRNPSATFADEAADYGIPPTNTLHLQNFDAPTPTHIQGARTVTTVALQSMMTSDRPPVLVDVIGGEQSVSLPNAVWLRDAGVGRHLDDDVQAWFDLHLSQLTGHDKSRPVVFFCASRMCWLAHNATLRALDLGYTNVYWYRGGRDSWQAAGLPMTPVAPSPITN